MELLELLKENMPDRIGGQKGWNFEKAHMILQEVRDIRGLGPKYDHDLEMGKCQ